MTNTIWRAAAGVFTLGVIIAGALVAWTVLREQVNVNTSTEHQTYDKPVSRLVFTDFESSDISVQAGESAGVSITREFRWTGGDKPRFTETWSGDTLTVSHTCGSARDGRCSVGYQLVVPAGVAVEAETSSGDVSIRGQAGLIKLGTVSGDISLHGSAGPVSIRSISGDVSTSDLRSSRVDASATSGDVNLVFSVVPQALAVQTTTGDTTIRVPSGSDPFRISLQSTSGDHKINVESSEQAQRSIDVQSTSGDVTISYV